MTGVLKLLIQSIQSRQCAIIRYDGQQAIRVVEPHVIYTHSSGNIIVECMQTRGHSGPDTRFPFWQGFYLKKINSVFLLDIHFEARIKQGFKPGRTEYQTGLLAMIAIGAVSMRDQRQDQRQDKTPNPVFYPAREWLRGVGDILGKVLPDKEGARRKQR